MDMIEALKLYVRGVSEASRIIEQTKKDLLYLADELERFRPAKFCMDKWYETNNCQTAFCAAGLAATLPRFKRRGLRLKTTERIGKGKIVGRPVFLDKLDYRAMSQFFKIDYNDAIYLFHPGEYPEHVSKEEVVARIRNYCGS